MDTPPPADPYNALGLSKDATAEEIKKAYRKLALRLHPDKCHDESQKAANTDEFHKVQQAYDIVGDEDKRQRYDAQMRLAELRRANFELRSEYSRPEVRTTAYDIRTAAPKEATFTTRGPPRSATYDDRRAKYYDYEEAPRTSSRKASDYDYTNVKRPSPPRDRERERERERERDRERIRVSEREAEERRRAERRRDAEVRDSRTRKYDNMDAYEEDRRRRDKEYEEELLRKRADTRRPPLRREEPHTSRSSATKTSSTDKMEDMLRDAQRHQERTRPSTEVRPGSYRTGSSRDIPQYSEPTARRSSATPRDERPRRTSPGKENDRSIPNLPKHVSSPSVMEEQPQPLHRAYTDSDPRRMKSKDNSPPPAFSRSSTMPAPPPASSSRRKEALAPSKLRHSATATPSEPYPAAVIPDGYTTKQYRYPEPSSTSVPPSSNPEPYVTSKGTKAAVREAVPSARRTRSPSPAPRPASNTAAKMAHLDPKRYPATRQYAYPEVETRRPSLPHTSSARVVAPRSSRSPDRSSRRDRDRYSDDRAPRTKLFGEQGAGYPPQPTSYSPDKVSYSKRPDRDDIIYSMPRGSRDSRERDFTRPAMMRATTFA